MCWKALVADGDRTIVVLEYAGMSSGGTLSNSAPEYTPTNADFLVKGNVVTSNEVNTVNSLIFNNEGFLKVFNTLFVTSGNFTVPTGTGTIDGDGTVITPGGFTKLGAGLLNLLGDLKVNGEATIASGKLAVNGTLTAQDVLVQIDAWLKGSGLINGNVFNSGTIAPGNSPGTLTINGNFTQSKTGTFELEVASTSVFDRLIVSGNASLNGRLRVKSFQGFKFQYGQQFGFLQAGSINGAFSSVEMPNPEKFRGRLIQVGDPTLTLVVAPTSYTLVAQNQNQVNVAKALDTFIPAKSGDKLAVSEALDVLTTDEYPTAFNAIMPGFIESLGDTTVEEAYSENQILAQRLSGVRLIGQRGFTASGMDMPLVHDKDGKSVLDAKSKKDIIAPTTETKWGVWVQGNGIFAKVTDVSQVPNYRFESGGFLGGADYKWNEGFTTGVYAGYQGTYSKSANNGSSTMNTALFGVYATYQKGGFYADTIIGGGYTNYNSHRPIQFGSIDRTANSQPDGGQLTTYIDAGYDVKVGNFTFGPIATGQYTYVGIAPFTESGAESLDLRVSQQNISSMRTNFGGHFAYTWNVTDKIVIVPELRLFWQHEYLDDPRTIGAALDGGSGAGFNYQTTAPGRDSMNAGVGVTAQIGDHWNANVYYNANFGRQDFLSNVISCGLGVKF